MKPQHIIRWKVSGMTCASCANTIEHHLAEQGVDQIQINYATGMVHASNPGGTDEEQLKQSLKKMGYPVIDQTAPQPKALFTLEHKLFICALLSLPFLLHMLIALPLLHNAWFQFSLSLPVLLIGYQHFGRGALSSVMALRPNMDVLILTGATAAFVYSLAGMLIIAPADYASYLFFETTALIVTLVFTGNYIEHRTVKNTNRALHELVDLQPRHAMRIELNKGVESTQQVSVSDLFIGDRIQVNEGDYIPIDARIVEGNLLLDESMLSGESVPVAKTNTAEVFAGTLIRQGNAVLMVLTKSNNTLLQNIITTLQDAQMKKPNIQRLGDRVSYWFVPAVITISLLTLLLNYFAFDISATHSIMRAIAVLVIACPCAMGLATPTAIAAGVGKAARKGILLKGGTVLEQFANIKTLMLDKTGTLTNGDFILSQFWCSEPADEKKILGIIASLEKNSSHPIAQSLHAQLKQYASPIRWKNIAEENGLGIAATDEQGDEYKIGSALFTQHNTPDDGRLYVTKNNQVIASFFLADAMKKNVGESIGYFKNQGIAVKLISGDGEQRCREVAARAHIDEVYWRQLPLQKLEHLEAAKANGAVAMVGDGINDAPSLAAADVGISFGSGSGVARNSASIVLMNEKNFDSLVEAFVISRNTLTTIKQNLFWALFYNVVAIPLAAMGYLSPIMAAFSMAFSDVVIIANSVRFYHKKVKINR